jgi:hypothetical protein
MVGEAYYNPVTSSMKQRALIAYLLVASAGCRFGPSEQRLDCLNGCAREKDSCMLGATTAEAIQACDENARICSLPCPQ